MFFPSRGHIVFVTTSPYHDIKTLSQVVNVSSFSVIVTSVFITTQRYVSCTSIRQQTMQVFDWLVGWLVCGFGLSVTSVSTGYYGPMGPDGLLFSQRTGSHSAAEFGNLKMHLIILWCTKLYSVNPEICVPDVISGVTTTRLASRVWLARMTLASFKLPLSLVQYFLSRNETDKQLKLIWCGNIKRNKTLKNEYK